MKTSNKILSVTAIAIVIGLFLQSFVLKKAYQKAIENPQALYKTLELKQAKYLNIKHHWNLTIKKGANFKVQLQNQYKDSLRYNFVGDSLNIDARAAGEIIIFTPNLPIMNFDCELGSDLEVAIEQSFGANINANFAKTCNFIIKGGNYEAVNVTSKENLNFQIENCKINKLNLNLPKHSNIELNYSTILAQNFILADSCSVKITGKNSGILEGKYYGTILN